MDVIRVINKVRLLSFYDFYTPRPLFAFLYACSLSLVPRTPTIAQGSIKEKISTITDIIYWNFHIFYRKVCRKYKNHPLLLPPSPITMLFVFMLQSLLHAVTKSLFWPVLYKKGRTIAFCIYNNRN